MRTTQRGHFVIVWAHPDGTPACVEPGEPLAFEFEPADAGTVADVATAADGRTATSTTTTGWIDAGEPTPAATCVCTADAESPTWDDADPDAGAERVPLTVRLSFSVEGPEEQRPAVEVATPKGQVQMPGAFAFDTIEEKPARTEEPASTEEAADAEKAPDTDDEPA